MHQGGLQINARHDVTGFGPSPCLRADTRGDPIELVDPRELGFHGIATGRWLGKNASLNKGLISFRHIPVRQAEGRATACSQNGFKQIWVGFSPVANLGPAFHPGPHRAHVERGPNVHWRLRGIENGAEHLTPTFDVICALCGTGGVQFTDQVVNVIRHRVTDGGDGGQDDSKQFRHPRAPVARSKRAFTAEEPC